MSIEAIVQLFNIRKEYSMEELVNAYHKKVNELRQNRTIRNKQVVLNNINAVYKEAVDYYYANNKSQRLIMMG